MSCSLLLLHLVQGGERERRRLIENGRGERGREKGKERKLSIKALLLLLGEGKKDSLSLSYQATRKNWPFLFLLLPMQSPPPLLSVMKNILLKGLLRPSVSAVTDKMTDGFTC